MRRRSWARCWLESSSGRRCSTSSLAELGKSGSPAATLILGAAVVDDVLGLLLLATLIGIGTGESMVLLPIAQAILAAGILLALAFWLGRPLARATVWITQRSGERSTLLVVVFAALLPRGEVGLVFAQIGLRQGVLTTEQFSALAVVIGATTFAGPLLLRRLWP